LFIPDGLNLLVGNYYFSPNTDVKVIENYFNSLNIKLNPQNFRVVLLGDFNVSGFDWANGFPQLDSHYYTKIGGDVFHSAACYLGLSQHNLTIQNKNLLDLVFANVSCVNVTISNFDLVESDAVHPSLVIDLSSIFLSSYLQPRLSVTKFALTMYCFTGICPLMIGPAFTISPLRTLLLISSSRWLLML
jgi:hypothetical protein